MAVPAPQQKASTLTLLMMAQMLTCIAVLAGSVCGYLCLSDNDVTPPSAVSHARRQRPARGKATAGQHLGEHPLI